MQFDAYVPAIAEIDGDTRRFADFFFDGLPKLLLERLDASAVEADPGTRDKLADIFNRVAGDIARWTAEHRQRHRVS